MKIHLQDLILQKIFMVLDFNFKLDQEFNKNLDKNAEISMIKKF